MYGLPVEMMVGSYPMLVVYNVGVAAGALTCGFTDVYRSVIGGSGGVYTLVGVHLANVLLNWHIMGTSPTLAPDQSAAHVSGEELHTESISL